MSLRPGRLKGHPLKTFQSLALKSRPWCLCSTLPGQIIFCISPAARMKSPKPDLQYLGLAPDTPLYAWDGSWWMNFFDLPFSCPPTCATRIDEDHHAFSIDSCWKRNERQSYRKPAQPWPKPSQPQENTRAIAQLEQCAQIPAMRLPCTMKAARVGGVDDQSRVCCALPCASSPCPFHSACGRIFRRASQYALFIFLCNENCLL